MVQVNLAVSSTLKKKRNYAMVNNKNIPVVSDLLFIYFVPKLWKFYVFGSLFIKNLLPLILI